MKKPVFIKEHSIGVRGSNNYFKETMLEGFNVIIDNIDNKDQLKNYYESFAPVVNEEASDNTSGIADKGQLGVSANTRANMSTCVSSVLRDNDVMIGSDIDIDPKDKGLVTRPYYNNNVAHMLPCDHELFNSINERFKVTLVVIRGSDGKLHNADSSAYHECCKVLFKYARGTFIINNDGFIPNNVDAKPIGTVIELPALDVQDNRRLKWSYSEEMVTDAFRQALSSNEKVNDLIFIGVPAQCILKVDKIIEISTVWPSNGLACDVTLYDHVPVMTVYDNVTYGKSEKVVRYTEYEERTDDTVIKFF